MIVAAAVLLLLTAVFVVIKLFQIHKARETEKYNNKIFLKNLHKIDGFLEQIAHFNDYVWLVGRCSSF